MNLNSEIATFLKKLGDMGIQREREALQRNCQNYSLGGWYEDQIAKVAISGAGSGMMGGPVGLALIVPDLMWCGRVSTHGCYGIGHILGREIDYDQDMERILLIWAKVAESATVVPAGKVAIKIFGKAAVGPAVGYMAGHVISKTALKGGTKLAAKLAAKSVSKAAAKLAAKLAAKTGLCWVPLAGGAASAVVNIWLVGSLMEAAEQYYRHDYLILTDPELVAEARQLI